MAVDCYPCAREREFPDLPPRERIAYDEHWRVAHATGVTMLGWLVLLPRRHVMEIAELSADEAARLGQWQVTLAHALGEVVGVAKTYVAAFGEAPGFHLHFHIIARPSDLAAERRGPGVFELLGAEDDERSEADRDALAERLAT